MISQAEVVTYTASLMTEYSQAVSFVYHDAGIILFMLESFLQGGKQSDSLPREYGQSVTDECLSCLLYTSIPQIPNVVPASTAGQLVLPAFSSIEQ